MLYGFYTDYSYLAVLSEDENGYIETMEFSTEEEAYEYFYGKSEEDWNYYTNLRVTKTLTISHLLHLLLWEETKMEEKEIKKLLRRIDELEFEVGIARQMFRGWSTFAMVIGSVALIELFLHRKLN